MRYFEPYYVPSVIKDVEEHERHLRNKAGFAMERALKVVVASSGTPKEQEQRAIAFGKAQAFYSLGLLSEDAFTAYRRKLGY